MSRTKKRVWTIAEWEEFGLRCQRTRDRVGRFLGSIPPTKGFGAKHIDSWMNVCKKMVHAMIGLENVLEEQYGEEVGVIQVIHGPLGTTWDSSGNSSWNPHIASTLTREQWADLGREVKAIHADVRVLMNTITGVRGVTKSKIVRFHQVGNKIYRAKWLFETLVGDQHPNWRQSYEFAVFNGSEDRVVSFSSI